MLPRLLIFLILFIALHHNSFEHIVSGKGKNQLQNKNSLSIVRTKSASTSVRKRKRIACHREDLIVDFSDLGWDNWIIGPMSYNAYTCKGNCDYPLSHHLNATNHATVQSIVHSISPRRVPKACCVPTKYSPLSLIHNDKGGEVIVKTYKNMVVEACGCR